MSRKPNNENSERVLLEGANWKELRFYQKSEALYQMTFVFCDRFLPKHGDRTVDQMVQAARSGKQNIVEGSEDGKTSTEMELKLLQQWCKSSAETRLLGLCRDAAHCQRRMSLMWRARASRS